MAIRVVQLGTPKKRGEGVRLGTVRRPPRGVRTSDYRRRHYFDVWLPNLAPSAKLMRRTGDTGGVEDPTRWRLFKARYRAEMKKPDARRLLDTLAALSHESNFSVGCYCDDERRCHRSILKAILAQHGAKIR